MLTSQLYTLPSVYHRNGGRERSESQYAGRWTKSTHAKYAAAAAARPVPWIPAIRSIYHTGTTLLRSTVGCRLRRPSVAAGTIVVGTIHPVVYAEPVESFVGALIYSCFVCWCCCPVFGFFGFILASEYHCIIITIVC